MITGSFPLDPDIALGDCQVFLKSKGRLSNTERTESEDPFAPESWTSLDRWRVKVGEFRKPDFRMEIEAAPDPDGSTVRATVRAFYHSGEPMVGAEVLGELQANPTGEIIFPESEFEWLYGTGYDWPLTRHEWMPDWNRWGIRHDLLGSTEERESFFESKSITFETTGATDEKGEVHLVFDAKLPLLKHFAYHCEVRAMVREHSGRSAVATKDFIHSGHPAELFVRPDKGFYRRGEEVTLQLDAMSVTREPQSVAGTLQIDSLGYTGPERSLTRQRVEERAVTVGANGSTSVTFTPPGPGQYQCLFQSGSAQRGIVLSVLDEEFDARDLRFNPIQLTPDRSVCAPGDVIELAIHCDRSDALVWVFQLMPDGRRQTPRLVQLEGKVGVVRITAPPTGAPNFQLMGLTAHHGVLHHTRCQISMPAREQVLSVDLVAKPESASPGDQLEVALEVRDHEDHPTMASLAVTAFDRSLEDLSDSLPKTRSLLPYWSASGCSAASSSSACSR